MLTPDLIVPSLFELTPNLLKKRNIEAVILDVDNTLRAQGTLSPYKGVVKWVDNMKKAGIKLAISSNNFAVNIAPFAEKLDLDFVSMSLKPFPFGIKRAIKLFDLDKNKIAMVGDQIYTDVLGGNFIGITTILVFPYVKEPGLIWKFKRHMEKPIIRKYYKKSKEKSNGR